MAKKRVSLTLEERLVDRVDSEAEEEGINRSRMVESVIESHFKRKGVDTAAVLCGDPENRTLQLHEGKPVLSHVLDHLVEEGVPRVFILAGQNRGEIESNYGSGYKGLVLEYVREEEPRGTAAALAGIENQVDGTFVVLNGHVITDVDLQEMLKAHRDEDVWATMALTTVEEPSRYGVARLKGRRILGFEEKPEAGEEPSRLINAGTYIFEPEIFDMMGSDSLEEVFENLAESGQLAGYIYGGRWKDVGV